MVQPSTWRLSVNLRDRAYTQVATMDFARRERIDLQLVQLFFKQHDNHWSKLFEFTNEHGELLAFRASAYDSHSVTEIDS